MNYVNVYCGDAVSFLKSLPSMSADAVVCDPPYGNGTKYNSYEDTEENLIDLVARFIPEALRVASVVAVTTGNWNMWLYPRPTWTLCWTVPAGAGSGPWGFSCWQPILVYGKDPYLAAGLGRRPDTFVTYKARSENVAHPCPKPIDFMIWLIERTTIKKNAVVVDPFMGSGTTGIACVITGRSFIGNELDPEYYNLAYERIQQARTQPLLIEA